MASVGATYTATSYGLTTVALEIAYSATGSAAARVVLSSTRGIFTPPEYALRGFDPVLRSWFRTVSKVMNDGVEGQEVVTEIRNTGSELQQAAAVATAAVAQANAATAAANEAIVTIQEENEILRARVDDIEVTVGDIP